MPDDTPLELVRADVLEGFGAAFEPTSGFALLGALDGKVQNGGDGVTFVPWQFGGRHVGTFRGIPATGREVLIVGTTAVDDDGSGRAQFHRFVDWANVLAQLGLTVSARPVG